MSNQLIKKGSGGYKNVFPKTFLDAITDKESGKSLIDIINGFNMYFLPYIGNRELTRLQLPKVQRRRGVWITYVMYDNTIVTEFYNGNSIEDDSFGLSYNWANGSNKLVGDLMVSSEGTWIVNGVNTNIPIKGEKGDSPILKVENNKLQVSYDKGNRWEILDENPVITKFKVEGNKLQISLDNGASWTPCSDYIASWLRVHNNKLELSQDEQLTWEVLSDFIATYFRNYNNRILKTNDNVNWEYCSDYIAAWFRWSEDNKIQISRTNTEGSWLNMSPKFADNVYIRGYLTDINEAPTDSPMGAIYMVGPNASNQYEMYVKTSSGWINNGAFTSVPVGVTLELGNSETEVMSQKAVTDEFNNIQRVFDGGNAFTKYGGSRNINAGDAFGNRI